MDQWACRTLDGLTGEVIHPARSRTIAENTVHYYSRIYATRNTYTGRAELVRFSAEGEWVPIGEES
jgi:hypothetical protein